MELNIGANIRKMRLNKGLTQEQLADILGISPAAVSKWEAKNTYPDITMLVPLAQTFNVSLDELMRYDEVKIRAEIETILHNYQKMMVEGKPSEATALITRARRDYPNDFQVMSKYIENISRDKSVLIEKRDEVMLLCDCILDNCIQEKIRLNAIVVKAKVMHICGKTESAIEMLSSLPKFEAALATEQIFQKGSTEFMSWNRRNCYSLLNIMAIKHARQIQFAPEISVKEKIDRLCDIAESYDKISEQKDCAFYCIGAEAIYYIAANMASESGGSIHDIICVREKHLSSIQRLMALAERDVILQELINKTYCTNDLLQHQINILKNSPHPQYANSRAYPEYLEMLARWDR